MKSSELMAAVLALPLDQKETFHTVLSHTIKSEQHANSAIEAELAAADAVVAGMPELQALSSSPGRPRDGNSAYSILESMLTPGKKIAQEDLLAALQDQKEWTREQASRNLHAHKIPLQNKFGVTVSGHGKTAVWSIPATQDN